MGPDPGEILERLHALLTNEAGVEVQQCGRFHGDVPYPTSWPHWDSAVSTAPAAVLLRFPSSGAEAVAMAVAGAGAVLGEGGTLLLAGNADEGCSLAAVTSACAGLFSDVGELDRSVHGSLVFSARRCPSSAGQASQSVDSFKRVLPVVIQQRTFPAWVSYPGLFAGGGMDVMTAALLSVLPLQELPAKRGRVLDFACGSGTIAAALHAAQPKLKVHALDADAVAIRAAAANVPSARVHLCSCWPPAEGEAPRGGRYHRALLPGSNAFNWIVSNPPVHRGQPDDVRVLQALCAGAASRLVPGGVLYIVAQEHIPVGCILRLAGAGQYADAQALRPVGGRFVVWRASTAAGPQAGT